MSETSTRLPCLQRFTFGVGHVLNDLCAAMWFCYLLVYFTYVLEFSNSWAGYVMLLGQLVDGICTPLVGLEVDRTMLCCKYGRRKSWHIVGTVSVFCSFPFLFNECITCARSDDWARFIYYAPFVVIFQFGWATTQVSHLSLIPHLTSKATQRVELNAIRYAFTVMSFIVVYVTAWVLFSIQGTGTQTRISRDDAPKFRNLTFIVVGAGTLFTLVFHFGTREKVPVRRRPNEEQGPRPATPKRPSGMTWTCWLKEHQFYQVALLYMNTRLVVNLTQVYIPLYVTNTLSLRKEFIAIVPLVMFVSGFVASLLMKPVNKLLRRKLTYLAGCILVLASCVWIWFLKSHNALQVFGAAIMLGLGGSTILVTVLSMTADLIGNHVESGAFVYGAMSFTDKLSNGIVVVIIQEFHPCKSATCCADCVWFYQYLMSLMPGGVILLSFVVLLTLIPQQIGTLRHDGVTKEDEVVTSQGVNDLQTVVQKAGEQATVGSKDTHEKETETAPHDHADIGVTSVKSTTTSNGASCTGKAESECNNNPNPRRMEDLCTTCSVEQSTSENHVTSTRL